jgi:hypothetical protein
MKIMSLISDVINNQHPRLMHMPVDLKKLNLSRLCFNHLLNELEVRMDLNKTEGLKVLGMVVEIVPGDGVHVSISDK